MVEEKYKLREDLVITRQVQRDEVFYVIKDPVAQTYYRFAEVEYDIISLFDGENDFARTQELFSEQYEDAEIDEATLQNFVASLKKIDLLEKTAAEKNLMLLERQRSFRKARILETKGTLLYKRVPLIDPDRLFNRMISHIRFFWTQGFFFFSLSAILLSYLIIAFNWSEIYEGIKSLYSFSGKSYLHLIVLWATVIVVIALHEFGHGLTCKHYGGEVHEMGFLLLFFQPCLYCNVNDAWTFEEKSKKLWVTFAGGYFEAFIGALATFVWWGTNPNTTINNLTYGVITVCGVSSLMFNFNPLIRLDGYYALSDYLELPNLRQNASEYVPYAMKKYIFRMDVPEKTVSSREHWIYLIYGVLFKIYIFSMLYFILFIFLGGFLIDRFREIGVFLLIAFLSYIFRKTLKRLAKTAQAFWSEKRGIFRRRKYVLSSGIAALGFGIWAFFGSVEVEVTSSCVLEPMEHVIVRTKISGIIEDIYVDEGNRVQQGDRILSLENRTEWTELTALKLEREKIEGQLRKSYGLENISASTVLGILETHTRSKLREASRQYGYTLVKSPTQGVVITPKLQERYGEYVEKGDELCEIANMDTMKVMVPVDEREMKYLNLGDAVELKVYAAPELTFRGAVKKISPVADSTGLTQSFLTWIAIGNPGHTLRIGMKGVSKIKMARVRPISYFLLRVARIMRMDLWF